MKRVLVVSDLHCGSIFGILPPGFQSSDDRPVTGNPGQLYLWDCWEYMVSQVGVVHAVVVNGDVIDGRQSKQRGSELILPLPRDQSAAAVRVLERLRSGTGPAKWYFVQGTEYHDDRAGREAEAVAEALGGISYLGLGTGRNSREVLDLEIDGVVLNFAHGLSVSSGFYRATAPDREGIWSALAGKEGKMPKADAVVRCLSEDTEILTRRGWLRHDEFDLTDEVLTFNPETEALEWRLPTAKIVNSHEPEMINIKAKGLDILVSPDHLMLTATSAIGGWSRTPALDLVGRSRFMPVAGQYKSSGVPLSSEQMRLLGLLLADGSVARTPTRRPYAFRIGQRSSNREIVAGCIRACGYSHSEAERNDLGRNVLDQRTGKIITTREKTATFYIPAVHAKDLLAWIDPDKTLHPDLMEMTPEQFMSLLEGLMLGDGSRDEKKFHNTNRVLMDQLQELMVKHGVKSSIRPVQSYTARGGGRKTNYVLHWTPKSRVQINQERTSILVVPYQGKSWCVSVPNGAIVVRREGGAFICGNSHVHNFVHVEHASKHILTTPCWQLQTRWMRKNSVYRMLPDIGVVLLDVDGTAKRRGEDPILVRKVLFGLPEIETTRL